MSVWVDYYQILQVPQSATQESIDRAYKGLCKIYHPDINRAPSAESRMKEINLAYEVLGNAHRRTVYNTQWLLNHRRDTRPRGFQQTSYEKPRPTTPDRGREAREAVQKYFSCISSALYKDAYALLSDIDKTQVSQNDFVDWQKAVGDLFVLRNYQVLSAQRQRSFELPDGKAVEAYRCVIQVLEEERQTGELSRYSLHKYVLIENGALHVHLGYSDLGGIAEKYRSQASAQEEGAMRKHWEQYRRNHDTATGLLNFDGFLEEARKEIYRYDRYKIDCCVMLLRLELPSPLRVAPSMEAHKAQGLLLDKLENFVADCLKKHLRAVDIPSSYARRHFLCLLAHTNMRGAQRAVKRLKKLIGRDVAGCFDIHPHLHTAIRPYQGGDIEETIENSLTDLAKQEEENAQNA